MRKKLSTGFMATLVCFSLTGCKNKPNDTITPNESLKPNDEIQVEIKTEDVAVDNVIVVDEALKEQFDLSEKEIATQSVSKEEIKNYEYTAKSLWPSIKTELTKDKKATVLDFYSLACYMSKSENEATKEAGANIKTYLVNLDDKEANNDLVNLIDAYFETIQERK